MMRPRLLQGFEYYRVPELRPPTRLPRSFDDAGKNEALDGREYRDLGEGWGGIYSLHIEVLHALSLRRFSEFETAFVFFYT